MGATSPGKGKGPPAPGGKGPPALPNGKGPLARGGKGGPPAPGGKAAPGAKTEAKAGAGGRFEPTKPKVTPTRQMKPLWWNRMLHGAQMKKGETVWDEVTDDVGLLDIEKLEDR